VGAAIAADVDGDGDLDLFLGARSIPGRYPETPRSLLLLNEKGAFTDRSSASPALATVGLVKAALFSDVDQDGSPDLIVATEWNHVKCFRNDGTGQFTDVSEALGFHSGGRGWWNSIAGADFNGDGRTDFALGNVGLNTTYRATAEAPATLLYGDFSRKGTPMLMEAEYDNAELYPVRGRTDLSKHLPFILRTIRRNDDFAKATLPAILGAEQVASARRFEADNFSSGVFLSQPDGSFRFSALPRAAQIGPINGLVATDLDGDTVPDLIAVQNSYAASPRFNGGVGLFLRGDGTGDFTFVHPDHSGIIRAGNGRALVVLDPDGNSAPDFFGTEHGGTTELYLNQAKPEEQWLTVRLDDSAGNGHAIGARIQLMYADGRTTSHEITLGGGWWSQAEPVVRAINPRDNRITRAKVIWPRGTISEHHKAPTDGEWILQP
jgi:hypothetical protein